MIVAESLSKDFGFFRAVDRVSFTVRPGEILGFLGPNGAGKTTTMRMITGFLSPTEGKVRVGDHDPARQPVPAKKLLGYLPEQGPLYPEMTVFEFLCFIAEIRGLGPGQAEPAILRVRNICHLDRVLMQPIETLSKGYRRRVGLAQSILHDPPVLVLDEPTDGLDPNQKMEIRELIASMGREKTIILSTHILEEVEAMCNRIMIIDQGKIVADDTPTGLLRQHPDFNAVRLVLEETVPEEELRQALLGEPKVRGVEILEGMIRIRPRDRAFIQPDVWRIVQQRGWKPRRLDPIPVGLDSVFHSLTVPEHPKPNQKPSTGHD